MADIYRVTIQTGAGTRKRDKAELADAQTEFRHQLTRAFARSGKTQLTLSLIEGEWSTAVARAEVNNG